MGVLHLAMGQAMDAQPFAKRIGRLLLLPRGLIDELRRPLGHVGLALSGRNTGGAAPHCRPAENRRRGFRRALAVANDGRPAEPPARSRAPASRPS